MVQIMQSLFKLDVHRQGTLLIRTYCYNLGLKSKVNHAHISHCYMIIHEPWHGLWKYIDFGAPFKDIGSLHRQFCKRSVLQTSDIETHVSQRLTGSPNDQHKTFTPTYLKFVSHLEYTSNIAKLALFIHWAGIYNSPQERAWLFWRLPGLCHGHPQVWPSVRLESLFPSWKARWCAQQKTRWYCEVCHGYGQPRFADWTKRVGPSWSRIRNMVNFDSGTEAGRLCHEVFMCHRHHRLNSGKQYYTLARRVLGLENLQTSCSINLLTWPCDIYILILVIFIMVFLQNRIKSKVALYWLDVGD